MGIKNTCTNFFQRWSGEKWYYNFNWCSKLVVIGIIIGVIMVLAVTSSPRDFEVLSGKIDLGKGMQVYPSKVLIHLGAESFIIPVTIYNNRDINCDYEIRLVKAISLSSGFKDWNGDYSLSFPSVLNIGGNESNTFGVVIGKLKSSGKQEVWLGICCVSFEQIQHELIVRLLVEG